MGRDGGTREGRTGDAPAQTYANYAARAFLLIIFPFIIGAYFLPHTQYMDGQVLDSPQELRNSDELAYSFSSAAEEMSVPSKVNAIFPLADYLNFEPLVSHGQTELCYQDNDSYLVLGDGSLFDPEFSWLVEMDNNRTSLTVEPEGTNCTAVEDWNSTRYKWYARMELPTDDPRFRGNVTFVPQTRTYPRVPMDFGLLQGLVMIPVAYLFVWYPAAGIWKKVHKGILEQ